MIPAHDQTTEVEEVDKETDWLKYQIEKEKYYELKNKFKIVENQENIEKKPFDFTWIY